MHTFGDGKSNVYNQGVLQLHFESFLDRCIHS